MNKRRKVAIANIFLNARSLLEDLLQEEEDAMDNVPESLHDSDRYHDMEEAVDFISDAISQLEWLYDAWADK